MLLANREDVRALARTPSDGGWNWSPMLLPDQRSRHQTVRRTRHKRERATGILPAINTANNTESARCNRRAAARPKLHQDFGEYNITLQTSRPADRGRSSPCTWQNYIRARISILYTITERVYYTSNNTSNSSEPTKWDFSHTANTTAGSRPKHAIRKQRTGNASVAGGVAVVASQY